MESTGEFWKPVYNLLEGNWEILVVNAQHVKNVPGRKTDILDAQWIAQLLRHGLLRGSLIPPQPQRDWRDLTRDSDEFSSRTCNHSESAAKGIRVGKPQTSRSSD